MDRTTPLSFWSITIINEYTSVSDKYRRCTDLENHKQVLRCFHLSFRSFEISINFYFTTRVKVRGLLGPVQNPLC